LGAKSEEKLRERDLITSIRFFVCVVFVRRRPGANLSDTSCGVSRICVFKFQTCSVAIVPNHHRVGRGVRYSGIFFAIQSATRK
jgi:hypothetical protein